MTKSLIFFTIATMTLLSGCGGGGSSDRVEVHHSPPPPPPPGLDAFDIVDSYGADSADSIDPLIRLNPYEDNGNFEIYWDAYSTGDYTIQLRINDLPYLEGSRLVSEAYCGPGLDCDLTGILFCEYYADFSMSCGAPGSDPYDWPISRFDDMIFEVPQRLYLILDLCDTQSPACEYRTHEVWFE